MDDKKTKKNEIAIDLDNLTRIVYNHVALWTQEEATEEQKSKNLVIVSREIIETVISEVMRHLDGVTTRVDTVATKEFYAKTKKKGIYNKLFR